jgi:hypothetical protein
MLDERHDYYEYGGYGAMAGWFRVDMLFVREH